MYRENQSIKIGSNKYKIIKLLEKQGNHSKVWLVKSNIMRSKFVLKCPNLASIDPELWNDRIIRAKNEVKILNSFRKSNSCNFIAKIFDSEIIKTSYGDLPIFIIEYCKFSLDEYIKNKRSIQINQLLIWIKQLTCAINSLNNELSTIHRDIKPKNILVNDKNEIRLIDFGIAINKFTSIDGTNTMFSNKWAAPEQVIPIDMDPNGKWLYSLSPSVDVYSLGLISYYIFTSGEYTNSQKLGIRGYESCRNLYWLHKKNNHLSWKEGLSDFALLTSSDKEVFFVRLSKLLLSSNLKNTDDVICTLWQFIISLLNSDPDKRPKIEQVLDNILYLESFIDQKLKGF